VVPIRSSYSLSLPEATNQNSNIPGDTAYYIGGRPYLLVERDTLPPTSSLNPLPPESEATIDLSWQSQDPGSGVEEYEVWVSEDGQPLEHWITSGTASATFAGTSGHSYGFAVRARDRAGNKEALPSAPQATTHVGFGVVISGPTVGEVGDQVALAATVHTPGATPPITFTWQATQQSPISVASGLTHSISLTWGVASRHTITVTAAHSEGSDTDTHSILIYLPSPTYLPIVLRDR
jgi:hypothetical protein